MKVIFLDIDGVLNVHMQKHDEYGAVFHPQFVENLKTIIDKTGAKIVISSSWRHDGLDRMKAMWKDRNLPGEVIDITPYFNHYSIRGLEIDKWNQEYKPENYVIIDDDSDMLPFQMGNFVCTFKNMTHTDYEDFGYGLTKECAAKAIMILERTRPTKKC